MKTGYSSQAAVDYLRTFLNLRVSRLAEARQHKDLGASAIELAIITAVLVGLAVLVVGIISTVVNNKAQQIQSNG
jgi:diacylglycerol kinase